MVRENEKAALLELKEIVQSQCSVIDFRVYGSKVRGTDTPESDVDVMIEVDECDPEVESFITNAAYEVNLEHDCFISVVLFSREEIEHGPLAESPLYKMIEKEGVKM